MFSVIVLWIDHIFEEKSHTSKRVFSFCVSSPELLMSNTQLILTRYYKIQSRLTVDRTNDYHLQLSGRCKYRGLTTRPPSPSDRLRLLPSSHTQNSTMTLKSETRLRHAFHQSEPVLLPIRRDSTSIRGPPPHP
jgi:hypothetical protein